VNIVREGAPAGVADSRWGAIYLAVSGFLLIGMRQNLVVPLSFGLSIGQFLLFGGGLLWILTRLRGQRSRIHSRALGVAFVCYLLAVALSYAAAMGRGLPPLAVVYGDQYMFVSLGLVTMAFAIIALLTNTDGLQLVLKGFLLGGAASAGFALLQSATGLDLAGQFRLPGLKVSDFVLVKDLMRDGMVRPQGSAGHPLELAVVLTILVPIGIGVIGSARAKADRTWPWFLCTGIAACGALATVSRSVVVGLGAAVVVMAWRWPVRRLAAAVAGLIVAVAVGWLVQLRVATALASSFAGASNDPSIASRATGRAYIFAHYREHFWFGRGVGTYPTFGHLPVLDNEYLSRLIEGGIFGLAGYVLLLGTALTLAVRASAATSPALAELGSGLSGAIAVVIVTGSILDISGFIQVLTLGWFIFALSAVAAFMARHGEPSAVSVESGGNVDSGGNQCLGAPESAR
jgi:putative inorganic carbon (hco3(-)) transporter